MFNTIDRGNVFIAKMKENTLRIETNYFHSLSVKFFLSFPFTVPIIVFHFSLFACYSLYLLCLFYVSFSTSLCNVVFLRFLSLFLVSTLIISLQCLFCLLLFLFIIFFLFLQGLKGPREVSCQYLQVISRVCIQELS